MDPRLGNDTSAPGEAVFAIRFIEKRQFSCQKIKNRNQDLKKLQKNRVRSPFGKQIEMSSLYDSGPVLL